MDFSFTDKGSSCVLVISAKDDKRALELLEEKVKYPNQWQIELIIEDTDGIG